MNARDFATQVAVGVVTLLVVDWLQKSAKRPPPPRARVLVAP